MAEKPNNAIQRETRKTVSALLVSLDQRTVIEFGGRDRQENTELLKHKGN